MNEAQLVPMVPGGRPVPHAMLGAGKGCALSVAVITSYSLGLRAFVGLSSEPWPGTVAVLAFLPGLVVGALLGLAASGLRRSRLRTLWGMCVAGHVVIAACVVAVVVFAGLRAAPHPGETLTSIAAGAVLVVAVGSVGYAPFVLPPALLCTWLLEKWTRPPRPS